MKTTHPSHQAKQTPNLLRNSLVVLLLGTFLLVGTGRLYTGNSSLLWAKPKSLVGLFTPLTPMVADFMMDLISKGINRSR
jgi:hypothetical protein